MCMVKVEYLDQVVEIMDIYSAQLWVLFSLQ